MIALLSVRSCLRVGVSLVAATAISAPLLAQAGPTQPSDAPVAAAGSTAAPAGEAAAPRSSPTQVAAADADVDIIITGSRIARPELATVQPTQVIGAAQIEARGYTNVTQALQELPGFGPPGNSAVGAQSSFGPAQSFVDFFSLGSQRTLTLVNGRRFVSSNTASIFGPVGSGSQVDLNNIPVTLVDHIDVVAVGGAPIYGSDAIAGTVNVILKHDYDGVEITGQYGVSEAGDAPDRRISALVGKNFAEGRGNITVSGEYNKVSGFTASDRAVSEAGLFFGTPPASTDTPFARLLYPAQRYSAFTIGGVPFTGDEFSAQDFGIRDTSGVLQQFGNNGRLVPLDLGTVLRQGYISSGGNGYDLPAQSNLLSSTERYLATAIGSYEFTDHIRAFGEAWYSHNKGTNIIAQPNYNTALFDDAGAPDGNLIIPLSNPFLNPADRATIAANLPAGQDVFYVGRALSDLTTGRSQGTVETYRFVGGFNGDFDVGKHNFKWEVSANYGHSEANGRNLELVQQNFENALDATTDANGNIICRPGVVNANIATISNVCAPLNIFGAGSASQAAKDYIFAVATPRSTNSQLVLNANTQGALFALPGGDLKFSLGYEYRRERTTFDPGEFYTGELQPDGTRASFGRIVPTDGISGGYHTNEFFGELVAPIVSDATDLRFLKVLELDGSARYVKNSLSGGDLTWTAGGRLGFFDGLTFRGNFTRAIRSPAITEVFNPTSQAFDSGRDPCDQNYVDSGPNPAVRRANCIAAGITDPDGFISNYSNFSVPVSVSGNNSLKNEKANSWTAGAIVQPGFAPGLSVAVDWVSIHLRKAITSLTGDQILNACYDNAAYPNSFCGNIDRDANGQITFIREGYFNAASYTFEGLTANVTYRHQISDIGIFGINLNYLYRKKLETQVGTDDIDHIAGEIGNPRHSGTANFSFERNGFNMLTQVQYVGKGKFNADDAPDARDITGVGDWVVVNATVGYDVNEHFGLKFIVDNIANRRPPAPFTGTQQAVQTYYSGIVGRYFRASASVKF
ncbi:TonB-dependent receptor [Sphingosinicellaceae bacterium]|nr:TonB-dependent receptor [Sphingosinicellaceae bacterium]